MSSVGGTDRHETLILRLEVGHEATLVAEPRENECVHTHEWTVFVRGQNETPLDSSLIQKVVFQLHDTIPNPTRVILRPPFEVTETGYGGFEFPIFVHFAHTKEEKHLAYDMVLTYSPHYKHKETRTVEFKDPKPELRAKLLKAGAEIVAGKSSKGNSNASSFKDLFGEALHVASPSLSSNDKPKVPSATSTSAQRYSTSPSTTNGSSTKNKSVAASKTSKISSSTASPVTASQSRSPQEVNKKRRTSKDSNASSGSRYDNDKANGAAQCLLNASKLPPIMSPIPDGICDPAFPSTSSATAIKQRPNDRQLDTVEDTKMKKSPTKIATKSNEQSSVSTGNSTSSKNTKRLQNGGANDQKTKRKKTKSDSGLDSDYSSGINAHSPGIMNGQNLSGANDVHGGANSLFSPPDSVRSLDTLQESPASAASTSSSGTSGASSSSRPGKRNGFEEHADHPTTSASHSASDHDQIRTLILLQQKIMTIKERRLAQEVADVISKQGIFEVTADCLEFDLCSLNGETIHRLLRLFGVQL